MLGLNGLRLGGLSRRGVAGDPRELLIVAGQSNGLAQATDGQTVPGPLQAIDSSRVKIWNGSAFVGYVAGTTSDPLGPTSCWGAEAEYARRWLAVRPAGAKLYIVKRAMASTPLSNSAGGVLNWDPATSGSLFDVVEDQIVAAWAALSSDDKINIQRRVIWVQGEQDATNAPDANAYQANLTAFISAVRSRWGVTGAIAVSRILGGGTYLTTVQAAQEAVAYADGTVRLINTSAYTSGDALHYDVAGVTQLGADAYGAIYGGYSLPAPVNTDVSISGTASDGSTLTATSTWAVTPPALAYQWKRDGVAISGATASTYVYEADTDDGLGITVAVTGTNAGGSTQVTSGAVFASSGGDWTPADDLSSALGLWFDAQDAATITQSAGNVSQWSDKSGANRHAVQATGAAQPAYQATGFDGSHPCLSFDYTNAQFLTPPDVSGAGWTAAEIFYVGRRGADPPPAGAATGTFFGTGPAGDGEHEPWLDSVIYIFGFTNWAQRKTVGNPTQSLANSRILHIRSAPDDWAYSIDGTDVFTTASNTVSFDNPIYIGRSGNAIYSLDGKIGELIVFNRALTTDERQKVEGYLAWRWGLQVNLPGGHPYLSAAP